MRRFERNLGPTCDDHSVSRRDLVHLRDALWQLSDGTAGVGVKVEDLDKAIGRGHRDMRTPLNLQSLSDEGHAAQAPDGTWSLTPAGVAWITEDRSHTEPMPREFDAQLRKGNNPGAWTCVVLDDVQELFGTRGLVKIRGVIDDEPFEGALMAQGDGTHRLPVQSTLREAIGKQAGDTVHVRIDERIG